MKHNKLVNTLRVSAALALFFGLVLTGCKQDGGGPSSPNNNSGTPPVMLNTAALAEENGALAANKVNDTPHMYRVPAITISGTDTAESNWGKVNTAVQNAGRYVILDLRACAFTNNTVQGSNTGLTGMNIFRENEYIKGIILPQSVTKIAGGSFLLCSALTSLTIPAGVTSIYSLTFNGCTALTSVTFEGDTIGSVLFGMGGFPNGGNALKELYQGEGGGAGTYTWNGDTWTKQP
jgi:hypothetical protein